MSKRQPVTLDLRGKVRNTVDFGPPTTIKIARELDTWVREYCLESGRTFRSVLEEGLEHVRRTVQLQPPGVASRKTTL